MLFEKVKDSDSDFRLYMTSPWLAQTPVGHERRYLQTLFGVLGSRLVPSKFITHLCPERLWLFVKNSAGPLLDMLELIYCRRDYGNN